MIHELRAIDNWKEKREFLLGRLASISDPSQYFEVTQQINEAEDQIARLERETGQRAAAPGDYHLSTPGVPPGILVFLSSLPVDQDKNQVIRKAMQTDGGFSEAPPLRTFADVLALTSLDDDVLSAWAGLFLAMPYGQTFSDTLIHRLVRWVHEGGRLIVTGYELGERHHRTNLNQLTYHFGIAFNSDVIVRPAPLFPGGETNKDYNQVIHYSSFPDGGGALFEGVRKIALRNACSLHLEPGAIPLVLVNPNQLRELAPDAARYSESDGLAFLAAGYQKFDPPYSDPRRSVAAFAPPDLTRKGRVLAMGSWDFRGDKNEDDNIRFIKNLWSWLVGSWQERKGP